MTKLKQSSANQDALHYFLVTFFISNGLLDTTIGTSSDHSTRCEYRSQRFYENTLNIYPLGVQSDYIGIFDIITFLLEEVHPITLACKQTGDEYEDSF